ncbi:MAG: hypothetical protein WAM98_00165 [Terriglobales bacterium]
MARSDAVTEMAIENDRTKIENIRMQQKIDNLEGRPPTGIIEMAKLENDISSMQLLMRQSHELAVMAGTSAELCGK